MIVLAHNLLVVLCLATMVSADYVRLSIKEILSIEPREWDVDHLWARLNLLTQNQNVTQFYNFEDWPRGRHTEPEDVYEDVPVSSSDPDLTLSFAIYNVGDKDPQEVGLRITSLVLDAISRIPVIGNIARIIDTVLDLFLGQYQCEGPVAVMIAQYDQQYVSDLVYDQVYCEMNGYSYQTTGGCANWLPGSVKNSSYNVKYCFEKHQGESSPSGGTPLPTGTSLPSGTPFPNGTLSPSGTSSPSETPAQIGSAGQNANSCLMRCILAVGAIALLMGVYI